MRYLTAFFVPPLAMLLCGKPVQALLSLSLCVTLVGLPIAVYWAMWTVTETNADRRQRALVKTMRPYKR